MEKYQIAQDDYEKGMKYKDIATKYEVSLNTVKSWKSRYWSSKKKEQVAHSEKGCTQKVKVAHKEKIEQIPAKKISIEKELKEFEKRVDGKLTEQQIRFIEFYVHSNNARQSALKAGYSQSFANVNVYTELLVNTRVKEEISKLKECIRQKIRTNQEDIINYHERVMNSDITDFFYENGNPKPLNEIDGRIVKAYTVNVSEDEITEFYKDGGTKKERTKTSTGITIVPEDRQKSAEFLSKVIGLDPSFEKMKKESDETNVSSKDLDKVLEVLLNGR